MCFFSNFGCKIIFMCSVNFWHRKDSNSLFKGSIGHVTSQCKWPIDYLICDQCTFLNVANFVVKQPSYLSDHSAIVTWLNLNTRLIGDETHTPNSSNRLSKLPRQFCWEIDSNLKFKNALRTEPIQILIRQYMARSTEDVNISLENDMKILTETSKLCLKIEAKKTYKRIKKSSNKKWFDCECRLKRHELRKLSNEKHRDPLNSELRERHHKTLNDYKKLLDAKKRGFHKKKKHYNSRKQL